MEWWIVTIVDTNSSGMFTVIAHFVTCSFTFYLNFTYLFYLKRKKVWLKSQGHVDYTE